MLTPQSGKVRGSKRCVEVPRTRWPKELEAWLGADFAGDVITRRSTLGLVLHLQPSSRDPLALSSGKSEFYPCVREAAALLGWRSLIEFWGVDVGLCTDSQAAQGFANKWSMTCLSQLLLWLQEKVELLKTRCRNGADGALGVSAERFANFERDVVRCARDVAFGAECMQTTTTLACNTTSVQQWYGAVQRVLPWRPSHVVRTPHLHGTPTTEETFKL